MDAVFGEISVENRELEDNILIKSDGMPTYNFANVIDDHLMNINCVMRGMEYLSSTPKYNLLYDAFGWERPLYVHMPPIMRDARHKLSKRDGSASYEDLLKKGYLKPAIINYIALLGWSPKNDREKLSFEELKELFSIRGHKQVSRHIRRAEVKVAQRSLYKGADSRRVSRGGDALSRREQGCGQIRLQKAVRADSGQGGRPDGNPRQGKFPRGVRRV